MGKNIMIKYSTLSTLGVQALHKNNGNSVLGLVGFYGPKFRKFRNYV
jgi:hypothetical protein